MGHMEGGVEGRGGGWGAFWERIRHFSKLFTYLEYIQIGDLKNTVTDVQSHNST